MSSETSGNKKTIEFESDEVFAVRAALAARVEYLEAVLRGAQTEDVGYYAGKLASTKIAYARTVAA